MKKFPLFNELGEPVAEDKPRLTPLSREARRLRRQLINEYEIEDPGGLAVLRTALEAFDRMRLCQAAIARDGLTFSDRWGQLRPHPLIAAERDSRAAWLASLKQLNLDVEPLKDGPGRPGGR